METERKGGQREEAREREREKIEKIDNIKK